MLNYIVLQGVNPDRLDVVVSKGESIPVIVSPGSSRENRRVTTFVAAVFEPVSTATEGKDNHPVLTIPTG